MLSVENLTYHYKGRPAVLKDVNFNVNTGEFLAILGNNGVGKSTMLKCFNKILTPDDGKIILDDENLLQMNARQVAQRVAFVAQSVPSIQMTVHDMVMLGRRPYMKWGFTEDDHQIVHHAMAQLQIEPLRGRFLNELSGGERQRIALARAILKNAPILILDEATAFADPDNEARVQAAFAQLAKGKTVIMIAHRLSTVANADCIYVVQDGQIVESGTKDELCAQNGLFARMWQEYQASVQWKVAKEG